MRILSFLILSFLAVSSYGQSDTLINELSFTGDFRFRIEQDWDSRKSNGTYRNDRSRLRFRMRFGLNYVLDKHSSFGGRLRTGNLNDQQGPHVTLGGSKGEFGLVSIGLEKLFYKYSGDWLNGWIGKNSVLLEKDNELFWNDNVFPDGVAIQFKTPLNDSKLINSLRLNTGHYIVQSKGQSFNKDSYFQAVQLVSEHWDNRIKIYPGFYYFKDLGNIPDAQGSYDLSYKIFHIGTKIQLLAKPKLTVNFDYYQNMQDYASKDSIALNLRDQRKGIVLTAKLGQLKKKGDWAIHLYLANLEKYSIVDYFAQNDWARWDYSSNNAAGSRLSNFQGMELRLGYAFSKKFNLILRAYAVEQLIKQGSFKENGKRIRLDMNIGF